MLKSLHVENFTAFQNAKFEFAKNLNVVIGVNGVGKSHVLKLAYSIVKACSPNGKDSGQLNPTKSRLQLDIAKKLIGVFKPDELGRLARRSRQGRQRCEVACGFSNPSQDMDFSFNTTSRSEVIVDVAPSVWVDKVPVYLPTRELSTLIRWFATYQTWLAFRGLVTHPSFRRTNSRTLLNEHRPA